MEYVKVRVRTESKKESIKRMKDKWNIAVREKAERGLANARVREVLAQELNVPLRSLRLIAGATSPSKTYLLRNTQSHEDQF